MREEYSGFEIRDGEDGWEIYDKEGNLVEGVPPVTRSARCN
jgi:hypothetical protein